MNMGNWSPTLGLSAMNMGNLSPTLGLSAFVCWTSSLNASMFHVWISCTILWTVSSKLSFCVF